MKLHPDKLDGLVITGYGPGWVEVNGERKTHSLIVSSDGHCSEWMGASWDRLEEPHFSPLGQMGAEVVIFGSGAQLRFPPSEWLQGLIRAGLGLETMDTAAACRTFNILANEGRRVVAALMIESQTAV